MPNITDIKRKARNVVSATATSLPDSDLFYEICQAIQEINARLITLNKNIRYDDPNYPNVPYGDGDLQNGVQAYASDLTMLSYERVEVQDINGNWHKINPLDESKVQGSLAEYKSTPGLPEEYAERGNSIFFYPPPSSSSVTLTGGVRFYFQRGPVLPTCTTFTGINCTAGTYFDGTYEPGFPEPAHYLISYIACRPYALQNKKDRVQAIDSEIDRLWRILEALVLNKQEDKLARAIPNIENTR